MEATTNQETVTVECHACFDTFEVSTEQYEQEEARRGRNPRFYCSNSCIYFDLY